MGGFCFAEAGIPGLYVIEPAIHTDHRGSFMEAYSCKEFLGVGINAIFVQDNQTVSRKGVLRGLHFQKSCPQAKLVRAVLGEIFDVAVDIRINSPTFHRWFGINLSDANRKQLYIPEGFAHGFLTVSDTAVVAYKCTDYYCPEDEGRIAWDNPGIAIQWPLERVEEIIQSKKDENAGICREGE